MEKSIKRRYVMTAIYAAMFILWTLLIKFVDVKAIGPEGSIVGFATLNGSVHSALGFNGFWYELTKYFGYFALIVAAGFACAGLVQLIKRKSIKKVDANILALGALYILVVLLYVFFEKVAVNFRPVILEEGLEPSYPSTHTFLILTIIGSTAQEIKNYMKNPKAALILKIGAYLIMILAAVGRLLSGVHWATDIVGGLLLATVLLSFPRPGKIIITE